MAVRTRQEVSARFVQELRQRVAPERVYTDWAVLQSYGYDGTAGYRALPQVVVLPERTEEVVAVARLCYEEGVPITPRGAGTNLSGGTIPVEAGVVIGFSRMQRIHHIDLANQTAQAEPGVITDRFHQAVEAQGLFYPPDPSSQSVSTLGGNVAENAGGLRGLKYGVTRDYVLGMEAVLADGTVLSVGGETLKNVAGYSVTQLLTGSEGTLALFTRLVLRLVPKPADRRSFLAFYNDLSAAAQTVPTLIAGGVLPATLEIMDQITLQCVEEYAHLGLPTDSAALLLIEVDGQPAQVQAEAAQVEAVLQKQPHITEWHAARDEQERDRAWAARRAALAALSRRRPTTVIEDATVPRRQLPEMFKQIHRVAQQYQLPIGTFGHAGDGNLHPTILCDLRDADEVRRVEAAVDALFHAALALGGTLSGEHGIGLAKNRFLHLQLGEAGVQLQRRIKEVFDPKGLLNPGKALGVIP